MEKYNFFEALAIVAGTDRRLRYKKEGWNQYKNSEILKNKVNAWWPRLEQQKEKVWEVEPEKSKDIFVWGVCDRSNGASAIFMAVPDDEGDNWSSTHPYLEFYEKNLFPKDKPVKCKIVVVKEDEKK